MSDDPVVLVRAENGSRPPSYESDEAAGADVRAHIACEVHLDPGERRLIPTGLRLEIPKGFEIQIRPRSGLALKHGVTVLNAPGTVDSDYRGEVQVLLINHGDRRFEIVPGMRIAQFVFAPAVRACYRTVAALAGTTRGAGGFGHTGMD